MITINANEAKYLRENIKGVHIYKTKKQKGSYRGFYYVEETNNVLRLLNSYQLVNTRVTSEYPACK